jgi:hypothetical protein
MPARDELTVLIGEVGKTEKLLDKVQAHYADFIENDFKTLGRKRLTAVFIAEVLEDFYTCLETLFLRISHCFENSLRRERWHGDLLDRMTIDIPGIRQRVISDQTYGLLVEILRFRHFKRYYFELDYDWNKLDFLVSVYERARVSVRQDLAEFSGFLEKLSIPE